MKKIVLTIVKFLTKAFAWWIVLSTASVIFCNFFNITVSHSLNFWLAIVKIFS